MDVRIYTDGGSRGNPGPAASGAVVKELRDGEEGKILAREKKYLGETTNNQAEYTAIIIGLERAKKLGARRVEVVMDSELAVRQMNGIYRIKDAGLAQRALEIYRLRAAFSNVSFRHVRREQNKEADALVNETLDAALLKKRTR